jgi:hypothetical protein
LFFFFFFFCGVLFVCLGAPFTLFNAILFITYKKKKLIGSSKLWMLLEAYY